MFAEALLVTPEGKRIILSVTNYQKVLDMLAIRPQSPPRPSAADIKALVGELRGKYAAGPSLVQALLDERRREREREDAQVHRHAYNA
jgi:hypothetical protein